MKKHALLLTLGLLLSVIFPVFAQAQATPIKIFRDANSLTVYASQAGVVSLQGLTFEISIRQGDAEQIVTRPLNSFPEFRALPFDHLQGPLCLRLERTGTRIPIPLDCTTSEIYKQALSDGDIFWYDSDFVIDRVIRVKSGGEIISYCQVDCQIAYTPSPFTTPATIPGCMADIDAHEVLVLIAPFKQLSEPDIYPEREWESILNHAIAELGDSTNARVFVLDDTVIESHDEARVYSDLCQATLVIWGEMGRTKIRSAYTVTPRWSQVETLPRESDVRARSATEIPELEIFISSFGGDSPYILQFVLGQLAYFDLNFDLALQFFDAAIQLVPAGREAEMNVYALYFYRGYINQEHLKDWQKAVTDYDHAIALNPETANAFNNRGNVHYDLGDLDGAANDINQAIFLNHEYAIAYFNRGIIRSDIGDVTGAIADYNQAIILNPTDAAVYFNRGIAHYSLGNLPDAIANYNKAIVLNPEYANAYLNRGIAHYDLGDMEAAISDINQAILLNPKDAIFYNTRGIIRHVLGDLGGAINDYNQSLELNAEDAITYHIRGWAYEEQGDHNQAASDWDQEMVLQAVQVSNIDIINHEAEIESTLDQAGSQIHFQFMGKTGSTLSIKASAKDSTQLDTIIILRGPDNAPLAANDDASIGISNAALENFVLPMDGEYTIVVGGVGESAGTFILEFALMDPNK